MVKENSVNIGNKFSVLKFRKFVLFFLLLIVIIDLKILSLELEVDSVINEFKMYNFINNKI